MAIRYSAAVTANMQEELIDILLDARVTEATAQWLATNNIRTTAAFADLAESKADIAKVMGTAMGLDIGDALIMQPVKTAWRMAEASTAAETDARRRGDPVDKDSAVGTLQRARIDTEVCGHYHFVWPAVYRVDNTFIGKLHRMLRKHNDFVAGLEEDVRNILEPRRNKDTIVKVTTSGARTEQTDLEDTIRGVMKFQTRHLQLMIAHSHAAAPTSRTAP